MSDATLERAVEQLWPTARWRETRLLIAVSGGADSVALLRALVKLAGGAERIEAAHFNHRWRGAESDDDESFVAALCESLNVNLHRGAPPTTQDAIKTEVAARNMRYDFLTQVAYAAGARYIATAHTASDRVETMLHNLFRGTGLAGVSVPSLTRPIDRELVLVRPLLGCSRADVLAYLQQLGQEYRTDSSNSDQNFRRNFIRHTLLPLVRESYGGQVDAKLSSFSEIAEEALVLQQRLAAEYLDAVERLSVRPHILSSAVDRRDAIALPQHRRLAAAWPVVQQALQHCWHKNKWSLQAMHRQHWNQIRAHWESDGEQRLEPRRSLASGQVIQVLPDQLELCRIEDWILIRRPETSNDRMSNA